MRLVRALRCDFKSANESACFLKFLLEAIRLAMVVGLSLAR